MPWPFLVMFPSQGSIPATSVFLCLIVYSVYQSIAPRVLLYILATYRTFLVSCFLLRVPAPKANRNGSKVCNFCSSLETIKHLFDCIVAKAIWRMVHWIFCLRPPRNVAHRFGGWSKLGQQKHNLLLLTGATALGWVIWLTRNDLVFNKCQLKTFLQVLFRVTYWLRFWAPLQWLDEHMVLI